MKKLLTFVIVVIFVTLALCTQPTKKLVINETDNVKFIAYLNMYKNNTVVETTRYIGNFNFNNGSAYILINRVYYPNTKLTGNWFNAEIYIKNGTVEKLILTPPHKPYNLTDEISKKIFGVRKNEVSHFILRKNPYKLAIFTIKNSKLIKINDTAYKILIPNNISKVLLNNGFGIKKMHSNAVIVNGTVYIYNNSLNAIELISKSDSTTYEFKLEVIE